ncbi:MAG: hypothetical protein EA427_01450 [Spirochaetaceae bacterium]|nr:MAG: hypothetical protein EA427_01450 [Spirochaetaceae bacterium]
MIQERLLSYSCGSEQEEDHALREITQEVILVALSRSGFFRHALFQGGTCLRIFYGLNRFSEDLDFILDEPNHDFPFVASVVVQDRPSLFAGSTSRDETGTIFCGTPPSGRRLTTSFCYRLSFRLAPGTVMTSRSTANGCAKNLPRSLKGLTGPPQPTTSGSLSRSRDNVRWICGTRISFSVSFRRFHNGPNVRQGLHNPKTRDRYRDLRRIGRKTRLS